MTSAGGSSSSGCLGAGFDQMIKLGGQGTWVRALISSLHSGEQNRAKEQRTPCQLQVSLQHGLRFTHSLCHSLWSHWHFTTHLSELHLNSGACVSLHINVSHCTSSQARQKYKSAKVWKDIETHGDSNMKIRRKTKMEQSKEKRKKQTK